MLRGSARQISLPPSLSKGTHLFLIRKPQLSLSLLVGCRKYPRDIQWQWFPHDWEDMDCILLPLEIHQQEWIGANCSCDFIGRYGGNLGCIFRNFRHKKQVKEARKYVCFLSGVWLTTRWRICTVHSPREGCVLRRCPLTKLYLGVVQSALGLWF